LNTRNTTGEGDLRRTRQQRRLLGGCQKNTGGQAMKKDNEILPGVEPLRSDWFVEKLGQAQQKVMSLTVENRALKKRLERIEERADRLDELVMDAYMSGFLDEDMTRNFTAVLSELNGDEQV